MYFLKYRVLLLLTVVALFVSGNGQVTSAQSAPAEDVTTTATELLVYDLNRAVTTADRGFPRDQPPRSGANGDWTTPVNYAAGTLHYRLEIRSQPQPQVMIIQLCIWQYNLTLENCGKKQRLTGNPNTVLTWSQPVQEMYKKNGVSIDWKNPRQRYGLAIKNAQGIPVSDIKKWNWGGENPNLWYPLNMRFTVVAVAPGATFSGWGNYISGNRAVAEVAVASVSAAGVNHPLFALSEEEFAADLSLDGSLLESIDEEATSIGRVFLPLAPR